jgi:surface antigen
MNFKIIKIVLKSMLLPIFIISGCATTKGPNENIGMVIGGIVGGTLGHQVGKGNGRTVATVIGTIIGTTIGGNVGRSMDDTDQLKVAHALETVRTGVSTSWNNPDTDYHYEVIPTRTYNQTGTPCREYQVEALIGGQKEIIYGTACRQDDGSWEVIK